MKKIIRNILQKIGVKKILEKLFYFESSIAAYWVSKSHKRLYQVQWGLYPQPEFFDHHIDLYWHWGFSGNSLWVERGVFGGLALKGNNLLELSCGDGFNAKHFYSLRSKKVIACDFDEVPLKVARSKNSAPNIEYVLADIRTNMPDGVFENITWDAAIEHFTEDEISKLMIDIKSRLTKDGILSGYTLTEADDGIKSNSLHEYEFKDMADLKRFFEPHFKNVKVFETIYPSRHNLYFWASNGALPFDNDWKHAI